MHSMALSSGSALGDRFKTERAVSMSSPSRPTATPTRTSKAVLAYHACRALAFLAPICLAVAPRAEPLPAGIAVDGKTMVQTLHANGVQIYECKSNAAGTLAWTFREPLATLVKDGKTVGRHFAGPTWELTDGSAVVGKVAAQAAGETTNDIAWLRLDVASSVGEGGLSGVSAVQRLNTHGGVFAGSCERAGDFHLEPYSADYVFSKN
jgi:hypothetical protein